MRRREFISLLGGAATWPLAARAQQPVMPVIGFLGASTPSNWAAWTTAFVQGLRALGWVEGRTVKIEYRWAEGQSQRYAEIAAEFARLKVDVIVTVGSAVPAAKQATATIPIVFAAAIEPVESGLVASLVKPGGNVTGFSVQSIDLVGKRIEILRELLPDLRQLAVIADAGYSASVLEKDEVQSLARKFGIEVDLLAIRRAEDIAPVFETLKSGTQALYVCPSALVNANRSRINTLALGARLPTIHAVRDLVGAGGLLSYGANNTHLFLRSAEYVDKILKGAKPADLPVEQPTKFELVIDLTTAKALRLAIPEAFLLRAEGDRMKRRQFIALLSGAAVAWPLAAHGQPAPLRRVGIFMDLSEQDPEGQARVAAFRKGLQDLGWMEGRNVRFDTRWTGGDPARMRRLAAEIVGLTPEVILNGGLPTLVAMQQETRTIPIVFAQVLDPVGAGFVESLARPGGNITGFVSFEYSMAGKWLETLKLMAPHIVRVAAIRDLASPSEMGMLGAIQAIIPAFAMPFTAVGGRDAAEFERGIERFAGEPNGGLIILPSPNTLVHRRAIMAMAARHRLPAIYPYGFFAREGGLLSYGIVPADNFRRAAAYVDRILKGANPGELPVQVPTKFELVLNLKTAKTLGLEIPPKLLATADELIE